MLDTIQASLAESLGREVTLLPGITTGFTDSRFMREVGIPSFGCTPGHPSTMGQVKGAHAPDEWTGVADLVALTRFFLGVLHRLCVEDAPSL